MLKKIKNKISSIHTIILEYVWSFDIELQGKIGFSLISLLHNIGILAIIIFLIYNIVNYIQIY